MEQKKDEVFWVKEVVNKYGHVWLFAYVLVYMPWFVYLEKNVKKYTIIHCGLDDKIPFCEYFIVPYLMWFGFVAATMIYLFFYSKIEFYKACAFLFTGMTVFLIVCTVFPNGVALREGITYHNNYFTELVKKLQTSDTSTNVFPSVHVFNSLGCSIALTKSEGLKKMKIISIASWILTLFIILSTVFLKQHSFIDVVGGFILAVILYVIIYTVRWKKVPVN